MKLIPSPKTIAAYGIALALTTGVALATDTGTATFDPTQLETTVTAHTQELNNHDARITTLENAQGGQTPVPGTIIQPTPQLSTAGEPAPTAPFKTLPDATPSPTAAPITEVSVENGYVPASNGQTSYVFQLDQPATGMAFVAQRVTMSDGSIQLWSMRDGQRALRLN